MTVLANSVCRMAALCGFVFLSALPQALKADRSAATQEWPVLISASGLQTMLGTDAAQLVDIRSAKRIAAGTIPGAIWMEYSTWRGPEERPGLPRPEDELEAFLGASGVSPDRPVVLFNHSSHPISTGRAAYVYWMLKTAGFEQVAILDGGFKAWDAAGLQTVEAHDLARPGPVDVSYRYDWWADPMDIFAVATNQLDGAILDARFEAQVKRAAEGGKPLMSVPLAQYIPVGLLAENLTTERISEDEQAKYRAALEERGIDLGEDLLISICQTGELSALSWFYASEVVGIPNVRYYPDAIQGWTADGGVLFGLSGTGAVAAR